MYKIVPNVGSTCKFVQYQTLNHTASKIINNVRYKTHNVTLLLLEQFNLLVINSYLSGIYILIYFNTHLLREYRKERTSKNEGRELSALIYRSRVHPANSKHSSCILLPSAGRGPSTLLITLGIYVHSTKSFTKTWIIAFCLIPFINFFRLCYTTNVKAKCKQKNNKWWYSVQLSLTIY